MPESAYIFKCPNCGANLVFSPKNQSLLCRHCGSGLSFAMEINRAKKPLHSEAKEEGVIGDNGVTVCSCSGCGAQTNVINGEIASDCPFCGATNITRKENIKGMVPDSCIPFTVEADEAESFFKKWLLKKWFIPTALKKRVRAGEIRGVYSPCYSFDADTFSSYSGVLGKHYTVYTGSGKNRRAVIRTRYFNISGSLDKNFTDVMIECSPHFDQKVLNRLKPFDMEKRYVYDKGFLSGFAADQYNKELAQGWCEAKYTIDGDIKRAILCKYSYDVVQSLDVDSSYAEIKYSYMLLPVYVSNYTFRQKLYNFFVNGNTGKTYGFVPRSPLKILRAVLISAAFVAAVILLFKRYMA